MGCSSILKSVREQFMLANERNRFKIRDAAQAVPWPFRYS